jgi:hypothetical protein
MSPVQHDPYKNCYNCPRRLTDGQNCHTAEYCPGWAAREAKKAPIYAQRAAISNQRRMSPREMQLAYRRLKGHKQGRPQ